ncbi:chemotaxis protein CheA [Alkalilimnicola ehrlichii]|uniref:Chemotaxis protein CheA n=1 Tax=Alkalilimnicola ehrlichii TaxID=351052 RepID=A0A3E0X1E1_9GAMM|nr:chemotaxis protein CheA [Alkalilimnicola ehrlichii]RFA28389.1 chemotaxis protein CheA [Alkalilimnicola ehrlichii]RFA38546.1 chemotaxis protein CheA [Alkalilimnicola ehrlichii]
MDQDDLLDTFLAESVDMLEQMERLLLELEEDAGDPEQLSALFRCVHTIKGSAGLFGFDHVVEFAHAVENVLDRLRDGLIEFDTTLSGLLFQCRDHIATLIDLDAADIGADICKIGNGIILQLAPYQGEDDEENAGSANAGDEQAAPAAGKETDSWHISVRFSPDVLRHGMEPLSFIRYLGKLGELAYVCTITEHLPPAREFDPEACYLGFEIDLQAATSKAAIEEVFEFVREDCELRILAPDARLAEYIDLIQNLPEEDYKLGEMLIASGALTRAELEEGLNAQALLAGDDAVPKARIGEVLVESGAVSPDVVNAALSKQKQTRDARAQANQYVRVQADKLDNLINLVGELVIASAAANLTAQRNGDTQTREAIAAVSNLVEEIRDGSLELRMVPIGETFQRFKRVVRDASQELGKDIRLEISGADAELDKTMVERIADPLTHMVRNAVDHGIEAAEVRTAAGKPVEGTVHLDAYHEAGSIVIEVKDDGGGLNRDKILAKALERGVIQSAEGLTAQETYQLIFEPGFSTAEQVTNLSGRGVGMDVVRRNIEALRGSVEVESEFGQGTVMRIRLPLTLAIIDGFLTGIGESRYVVPLESVVECVELTPAQRAESRQRSFVNLRGEVLPFIRLRDYFGLAGEAGRRENIVVVRHGPHKAGLIVDSLLGEYQTVIKPLGKLFSNLGAISGSTILGSGEVALILDVPALTQRAAEQEARTAKA